MRWKLYNISLNLSDDQTLIFYAQAKFKDDLKDPSIRENKEDNKQRALSIEKSYKNHDNSNENRKTRLRSTTARHYSPDEK